MLRRHIEKRNKKRAQSTVEYILLAAAVIAALVLFLRPGGPFANSYNSALSDATNSLTTMSGRLSGSYQGNTDDGGPPTN